MTLPRPEIDPDGLLEYSVVFTDRSLNHMSKRFVGVMQDILSTLKSVYHAHTAVLVPGSGTFGMEAVARQFANREKVLIVRNGWFSFRWSQIFDAGGVASSSIVCQARKQGEGAQAAWVLRRWQHWGGIVDLHVVGLSATLKDGPGHLGRVVGLAESEVLVRVPRVNPSRRF